MAGKQIVERIHRMKRKKRIVSMAIQVGKRL
jgi:hypothetical protein